MSKIVCDICGTSYPDTEESCPTCGWNGKGAIDTDAEEMDFSFLNEESKQPAEPEEEEILTHKQNKAPKPAPAKQKREIFDYDAVNPEPKPKPDDEDDEDNEDEDEDEEESGGSPVLVILLVLLILILLLTSGFIFWRYYLPNRSEADAKPTEPSSTVVPTEDEGAVVPCDGLALVSGGERLTVAGQQWILYVKASPENTTDAISFTSEDESVAVVSADGCVTAVGEGKTNIVIICGEQRMECPVEVAFEAETEAPTEAPTEEVTEAPTEEATEAPTEEATEAETEAPTEEATAGPEKDVVLKLEVTDITFYTRGVYRTLGLECDLTAEEVEWSVRDTNVATVNAKGQVTSMGAGLTVVTAKYGDQTATCIVRCSF